MEKVAIAAKTILIVDDRAINRKFLEALLEYAGYRVVHAVNGAEALEVGRAELPALLISDVLMPVMDGVELATRMQADPQLAQIPVIFYTATYRLSEARQLAENCGVKTVLAKPADPQQILDAVAAALGVDSPAVSAAAGLPAPKLPKLPHLAEIQHRLQQAFLDRDAGARLAPPRAAPGGADVQALSLRLAALLELSMVLSAERNPQQLLHMFCRAAQNIMNARFAAVCMCGDSGRTHHACRGLDDADVDVLFAAFDSDGGALRELLGAGKSLARADAIGYKALQGLPEAHPLNRAFLVIPVMFGSHACGWIYLADKLGADRFDEEDQQFAVMLAAQLSPSYENLILYEEVQRHAGRLELEIVERKQMSGRIANLNRIYAVLSGINSAIVRIHNRKNLLQEACRVAVDCGAFSLAWAGLIEPDALDGEIVARAGGRPEYVDRIQLTIRTDTPESRRPACTALREKRVVVCNDISTDPMLEPFKGELLAHDHRSVMALPLMIDSAVVGVITLFASEAGFFDDEEIRLVTELAGDLSFGLQFIQKEEQLSYLAYYDVLTGLPNSMLFRDRLVQLLRGARHDREMVAVIVFDLAGFSRLNDALGRHAGDAVLIQTAQRLKARLQEPCSVARLGGDSFAIAVAGLQQGADAMAVLEQQIFAAIEMPFAVDGREVSISAHAGLALFPDDGSDAASLFKHADIAFNKARSGHERYVFYAPQMNAAIAARLALEGELRTALEAGQFLVHYQPRVDLLSGRIVSAEALIRWQHPERGMISPAQFIPLAEETGLIVPIGAWVIDAVCAQQAAWLGQLDAIVPVAVNLSAVQFRKGQVVPTISDALERHRIGSKYIEFELTESIVVDDPEQAARSLQALKEMGVCLSLDDFGTGYSSLAYLKRFPFDIVKIDRTFVADITRSAEDAAIATAVIAMAHSLGLRVVAEGVETEGQLRYLRRQHCDEMQGYFFSPPVPAAAFEAMLRSEKRLTLEHAPSEPADTLLIVDDEQNILSALKSMLRREGYQVLTASSAQEGLDLLAVNTVQVIVADQRMPGMSGSEFLGIVKELYPDTIRIILSGYTDLAAVTDSINRGAVFKFLTKPWEDDQLRDHIRDAFRRYRPGAGEGR